LDRQKKKEKRPSPAVSAHLSKKQMTGVKPEVKNNLSNFFGLNGTQGSGAPGETRTPDPLLRSYAVQNSKCRFWCRLRGSASFISPLNWTEVGLKLGRSGRR